MDLCRTLDQEGNPISNEIELTFTVEKEMVFSQLERRSRSHQKRKTCWMDLLQSNFEAGMAVKM